MKIIDKFSALVLAMALLFSIIPAGAEPLTDDTDMTAFVYDTFTMEDAATLSSIAVENGAWTITDTKGNNPWSFLRSAVSNGAFVLGKLASNPYGIAATRTIVPPADVDTTSKKYVVKFDLHFDAPDSFNGADNPGVVNVAVNGTAGGKIQPAAKLVYNGSGDTKGKLLAVAAGTNTVLLDSFDPTESYEIKIELDFNTGLSTYTIGETHKALAMAYNNAAAFTGALSSFVIETPQTKPVNCYAQLTLDNFRVGMAIEQDTAALVAADLEALSIGDVSAVEHSFILPSLGSVHNSVITWESKFDGVAITKVRGATNEYQACVTRPKASAGDATGQLVATVTNGSVSDTRSFDVTVKALESPSGYADLLVDDSFSGEYLNPTTAELANGVTASGIEYVPVELDHWLFASVYKRTAGQHGFRIHEDGYLQLGHNVPDDCAVEAARTLDVPESMMTSVGFRVQFAPTIPAGSEATHDMQLDLSLGMPRNDGGRGNITLRYTASERSVVILGSDGNPILNNVDNTAWYALRIDLNYAKHSYDVYVNGKKCATAALNTGYQQPDRFVMTMQRFKSPSGANFLMQGLVGLDDFQVSVAENAANADLMALDALDGLVTADYLTLPKTAECSGIDYTWSAAPEGLLTIKEYEGVLYGLWDKAAIAGETAQVTLRAAVGEASRELTVTVQNRPGIAYLIDERAGTVRAVKMEEQAEAGYLLIARYAEGRLVSVAHAQTQAVSAGEVAASLPADAAEGETRTFLLGRGSLAPLIQ